MLTKEQKLILETIFQSDAQDIASWGGGTALSELYLHHRRSDDIDIILSDLLAGDFITLLANQIQIRIHAKNCSSFNKMNRSQYVYELADNSQQKLEFVYYPFPKLKPLKRVDLVKVESLLDISVSKTLAAYQRHEIKDAFDLFVILKDKHFALTELTDGVEKKFGEAIDTAALLAKMSDSLESYEALEPIMIREKYSKKTMLDFFQKELEKFLDKHKL